jgi:hypothetical protein
VVEVVEEAVGWDLLGMYLLLNVKSRWHRKVCSFI